MSEHLSNTKSSVTQNSHTTQTRFLTPRPARIPHSICQGWFQAQLLLGAILQNAFNFCNFSCLKTLGSDIFRTSPHIRHLGATLVCFRLYLQHLQSTPCNQFSQSVSMIRSSLHFTSIWTLHSTDNAVVPTAHSISVFTMQCTHTPMPPEAGKFLFTSLSIFALENRYSGLVHVHTIQLNTRISRFETRPSAHHSSTSPLFFCKTPNRINSLLPFTLVSALCWLYTSPPPRPTVTPLPARPVLPAVRLLSERARRGAVPRSSQRVVRPARGARRPPPPVPSAHLLPELLIERVALLCNTETNQCQIHSNTHERQGLCKMMCLCALSNIDHSLVSQCSACSFSPPYHAQLLGSQLLAFSFLFSPPAWHAAGLYERRVHCPLSPHPANPSNSLRTHPRPG